jgi:hypothetical protein
MGISGPKNRATFSIARDIKNRLEGAVPKNERSRYVEKAIDQALRNDAREGLKKMLDELPRASPKGESTTDFLRRKRLEWDGRPLHILEGTKSDRR